MRSSRFSARQPVPDLGAPAPLRSRRSVIDPEPVEVGRVTVRLDGTDRPYTVTGGADAEAAALLVVGRILREQRAAGGWPPGVTRAG